MKERLLTALVIAFSLVLAFVLKVFVSPYIFDAFIGVVCAAAAYEFAKMLTKMGKYNHSEMVVVFPVILSSGLALSISLGAGYFSILIGLALLICFTLGVFFIDLIFVRQTKTEMKIRNFKESVVKFAFKKSINTLLGYFYPSFFLSTMVLLNHFEIFTIVGKDFANLSLFVLLFAFLILILTCKYFRLIYTVTFRKIQ